jgi:hypothetical protein
VLPEKQHGWAEDSCGWRFGGMQGVTGYQDIERTDPGGQQQWL